jgi:hypothetical protein
MADAVAAADVDQGLAGRRGRYSRGGRVKSQLVSALAPEASYNNSKMKTVERGGQVSVQPSPGKTPTRGRPGRVRRRSCARSQ